MTAGLRDRRIRIEEIGPAVDDGVRTKPGGWLLLYGRWAQLLPGLGSERSTAAEPAGIGQRRFRFLRSRTKREPTTVDRLVYGGQLHDIVDVQPVGRAEMEVTAMVRTDADPDSQADA